MSLQQAAARWPRLHFTGIGGVGMTALALIADDLGIAVTGSDLAESANTRLLQARGIAVTIGSGTVPDNATLIYSSAVPAADPERRQATSRGLPQIRRGEFLGQLSALATVRIAVAGSHGKTSTTAILAHLLRACGIDCAYAVGGLVPGWHAPAAAGAGEIFVFEVDESDGTQTAVAATHAVITNLDDDHCWSVGGEAALQRIFADFANRATTVFAADQPLLRQLLATHRAVTWLPQQADPTLPLLGNHNRLNGATAIAVAATIGVDSTAARAALASFPGVDRRMSIRHDAVVTIVEDYAHHPAELNATLNAVRERWPERRLLLIFQPHRNERVARYHAEFAAALAAADHLWVTRPFDAWIDDADLADPRQLLPPGKANAHYRDAPWPQLANEIADSATDGDLILIIGAGTINQLPPLLIEHLAGRQP